MTDKEAPRHSVKRGPVLFWVNKHSLPTDERVSFSLETEGVLPTVFDDALLKNRAAMYDNIDAVSGYLPRGMTTWRKAQEGDPVALEIIRRRVIKK